MQAQSPSINYFYNTYRGVDGATNISVGSFLIRIASAFVEDHQTRTLIRKAKRVRLIAFDDVDVLRQKDLTRLINGVKNETFEELMTVKEDGSQVRVFGKEEGDWIRNILLLVDEEDEFVMIGIKCKMTYDDITAIMEDNVSAL
jgi:hypothetical protein